MKPEIRGLVQNIIINTSFPPLTYLYRKIYDLSVAVATLLLRRVDGVLTIYLRRGVAKGEVVYGLSDIDLSVIVKDEDGEGQVAKEKVRETYSKLSRVIPLLGSAEKELGVYSASEFLNLYDDYDFYKYRFNEGRYTWRLLFGRDLVKALPHLDDSQLYLPATEELKSLWASLNAELVSPSNYPRFERKYLWYKAISEAAKIYLFVCHDEKVRSRETALSQVKRHLTQEQRCQIDKVQSYRRHLTSKEDPVSDELMRLFITLAGKALEEMERKLYADSKGKRAILNVPAGHDPIAESNLAHLLQRAVIAIRTELEPYLDAVALIPQVEFDLDVLSNSDIDSFYLVLIEKSFVPIEKLRRLHSLFADNICPQKIAPFIVVDGRFAFSLQADEPQHCVKSCGTCPLFFSMLPQSAAKPLEISPTGGDAPIHCYLPPITFEQGIKKRVTKLDAIISSKNVYKMRTLDLLRFFWGAARTKLLAHSLELEEIHIPLTSRQILEALLQSFPDDSDWLNGLYEEYAEELLGKENEAYRFFSKSIALLNRI